MYDQLWVILQREDLQPWNIDTDLSNNLTLRNISPELRALQQKSVDFLTRGSKEKPFACSIQGSFLTRRSIRFLTLLLCSLERKPGTRTTWWQCELKPECTYQKLKKIEKNGLITVNPSGRNSPLSISRINQLMHTMATAIQETLGYMMSNVNCRASPPMRKRLEVKIKATESKQSTLRDTESITLSNPDVLKTVGLCCQNKVLQRGRRGQ